MKSMTYGVMPTRKAFYAAFNRECPDGYNIQLGSSDSRACDDFKLGDGVWTDQALYDACKEIVSFEVGPPVSESDDTHMRKDDAMQLVSGIMETLGFEWV